MKLKTYREHVMTEIKDVSTSLDLSPILGVAFAGLDMAEDNYKENYRAWTYGSFSEKDTFNLMKGAYTSLRTIVNDNEMNYRGMNTLHTFPELKWPFAIAYSEAKKRKIKYGKELLESVNVPDNFMKSVVDCFYFTSLMLKYYSRRTKIKKIGIGLGRAGLEFDKYSKVAEKIQGQMDWNRPGR